MNIPSAGDLDRRARKGRCRRTLEGCGQLARWQERFGITPDLATFGKGMANGLPLSAVVGKKELMKEMEEVVEEIPLPDFPGTPF